MNKHPRSDNFIKRRRSLNESAAMAALTLAAHRVLLRLEIELMQHGGTNNGKLICTFDDLEQFGIRRKSIAAAIRLLAVVGLIEITLPGWRRAAHGRPPLSPHIPRGVRQSANRRVDGICPNNKIRVENYDRPSRPNTRLVIMTKPGEDHDKTTRGRDVSGTVAGDPQG
jgi:hypothetical protein